MKKVIFSALALSMIVMFSCQKEKIKLQTKQQQISNEPN